MVALPKIDGAALPAGWAGAFIPKEKVDLDVSLLEAAVEAAAKVFGRLDVVIANAGYINPFDKRQHMSTPLRG